MNIGIDARFAVHKRRGIGNYTLKLIQHLAELDAENNYILYIDRDDMHGVLPNKQNFKIRKIAPSNYFIWEQVLLPIQARMDCLDILHCTGNTGPVLLSNRIRLILTIHDVMYLKDYSVVPRSLSMYQRLGRLYRKIIVPLAVKRVSKVITVSEYSRRDIQENLPAIAADSIIVTHEAADEIFTQDLREITTNPARSKFGILGDYIFTLGALDPRKNTKAVIDSYLCLREKKSIELKLVISGIPDWRTCRYYRELLNSKFAQDVLFTDFITQSDLISLYRGAKVFLYPSLYEGFGIPPLEAMSCGAPVITSDTTSIPEIVGDAAMLINPSNWEDLAHALSIMLDDEDLRGGYIRKGLAKAKEYSWRKLAVETCAIYNSPFG